MGSMIPILPDGYVPTVVDGIIKASDSDAATGRKLGVFPKDTLIFLSIRSNGLTGGTSPAVTIGTSAGTGTEIASAGSTTAVLSTCIWTTDETPVYAALTGTPTGGEARIAVAGYTIKG